MVEQWLTKMRHSAPASLAYANESKTMREHTAYAIGKYGEAYYSLATGPDEIRKRLIIAANNILAITPDMVPDEVGADVKWIHDQFHRKETIERSIRGRHHETCVNIAKRIVYIYCKLKQLNSIDCNPADRHDRPINIEIKY